MLLSDTFQKLAIFRDVSIGDVERKTICLSMTDCKNDVTYVLSTGDAFKFTYPDYKKYFISMEVVDQYANISDKRWTITMTT
jgi:hypothetical protein